MKLILSALTLATALGAPFGVHAADSILRVTCDADAARAEISVNGVFKGECPLDVQVKAGSIQLQALKKVDASRERTFADEFRIGEGVAKKVEVTLSAPRLNAAGQKREDERLRVEAENRVKREEEAQWGSAESAQDSASVQRYIDRYPAGAHVAAAQDRLVAIRKLDDEVAPGRYTRGSMGVQIANVTSKQAPSLGLQNLDGALINAVQKGGPADKAGILASDVILKLDGKAVTSASDLQRIVRAAPPGRKFVVQLWRKGGSTEVKLVIGELTDEMFFSDKTRAEILQTRGLFPDAAGSKLVTLKVVGNVLNESGLQQFAPIASYSYELKIYNKNGICNWEMSTGVTGLYFGAGLLPAGSIGGMLAADEITLRSKQEFVGSLASMTAGQTLRVSSRTGETQISVAETRTSWPELNFPYAGTRLIIAKNYEPSYYYDREQTAIYSPEIGCSIPLSQEVVQNMGNRMFGDKYKFSEKTLSAVITEK